MHKPSPLEFHKFQAGDPLDQVGKSNQLNYLRIYLTDLGASSILLEPHYFDRDYLSEFASFYSISSRGYVNVCKRLHFFKGEEVSRELFSKAAQGDTEIQKRLNEDYLGFCVIRPIPQTPLGRTVLRWYADKYPNSQRIVEKRAYECHVAGTELTIEGLAWQQQDTGVGACATVALWSALHSLAFDEFHSIPTTSEITEAAHMTASLGSRVFPTSGLTIHQLCEAIKELGLAPVVQSGEFPNQAFSKERFMSSVAAYVRSGYPVIVIGKLGNFGLHAICIVGFREPSPTTSTPEFVTLQDSDTDIVYLHDDNLGPNVRSRILLKRQSNEDSSSYDYVALKPEAPQMQYSSQPRPPDPTASYPEFIPMSLVVAVHNDLRTSPETLYKVGLNAATKMCEAFSMLLKSNEQSPIGLTLSTRFLKLTDYINRELERTLASTPVILGNTRLALWENVPPMSLHLGVVRIGTGSTPLLDIIYDTTDSDRNHPVFAHVLYNPAAELIAKVLTTNQIFDFGIPVKAY